MRAQSSIAMAVAVVVLGSGCGPDLGECNMSLLGGSDVLGMERVHQGQVLVNNTCAAGRCHSESAKGDLRVGVPAGLNFDVVAVNLTPDEQGKVRHGRSNVREWAETMWALIDDGDMPPEGRGTLSSADKETIRNWLACDAPAPIATVALEPTWASIFGALSASAGCLSCHGSSPAAGGGFQLATTATDACAAYRNVAAKMAVSMTPTANCGASGLLLIVAGDPDNSLLYRKLFATPAPSCGASMPYGGTALAESNPELATVMRTWIEAGALPPAGCSP